MLDVVIIQNQTSVVDLGRGFSPLCSFLVLLLTQSPGEGITSLHLRRNALMDIFIDLCFLQFRVSLNLVI